MNMLSILERLDVLERRMDEIQNPDRYSRIKRQNRIPEEYEIECLKKIIGVK